MKKRKIDNSRIRFEAEIFLFGFSSDEIHAEGGGRANAVGARYHIGTFNSYHASTFISVVDERG